MNLAELQRIGGLVSGELIQREVQWASPSGEAVKFKAFSRKPSYADIEASTKAEADGVCSFGAALLSRCVGIGEGGLEKLSIDDVRRLEPSLFNTLFSLVFLPEVKKEGEQKKPLRRKKNSGTS